MEWKAFPPAPLKPVDFWVGGRYSFEQKRKAQIPSTETRYKRPQYLLTLSSRPSLNLPSFPPWRHNLLTGSCRKYEKSMARNFFYCNRGRKMRLSSHSGFKLPFEAIQRIQNQAEFPQSYDRRSRAQP